MDEGLIQIGVWLLGSVGAIVALLLAWIAFMIREDKAQNKSNYAMHDKRLNKNDKQHTKYDKKFDKQHNEIKGLIEVLNRPQIKKGTL